MSGENTVWKTNGTTLQSFQSLPTVADLNWHIEGTGDVDGDRQTDIVWFNHQTGRTVLWKMNGTTLDTVAFAATLEDTNWQVQTVTDFNQDGKADILWHNSVNGASGVWFINSIVQTSPAAAAGDFAIATASAQYAELPTVSDTNWRIFS